mmetsp:Transcript_49519/g.118695  ORF Transcript_49519/g.118695 Transcript_49519/m.118695 type:complete len:203 (-) Transcript_49519:202-810(-)
MKKCCASVFDILSGTISRCDSRSANSRMSIGLDMSIDVSIPMLAPAVDMAAAFFAHVSNIFFSASSHALANLLCFFIMLTSAAVSMLLDRCSSSSLSSARISSSMLTDSPESFPSLTSDAITSSLSSQFHMRFGLLSTKSHHSLLIVLTCSLHVAPGGILYSKSTGPSLAAIASSALLSCFKVLGGPHSRLTFSPASPSSSY